MFKVKLDENGEAARYKCRLVAQGYTQAQGVEGGSRPKKQTVGHFH